MSMNQWSLYSQSEGESKRISFLFRTGHFWEQQREGENKAIKKGIFLKRRGRSERDASKATSSKALFEDLRHWGLCNNCELHLLGKITTTKPAGLICLGCLQTEQEISLQ